jgi:PKD repeat protein
VSYAWSNGATGPVANDLVEGTYLVTATDAVGCEETTAVYVALSPQLDVTFNSPGCTGEGDTELHFASTNDVVWDVAVNHAENGIPFESLMFEGGSTQLTGLPTGDYIVTYQDNVDDGCPSTSLTISMVEAYTMNVVTNLTEMECGQTHDGAIELMVTGGMGNVSATWDHGVEGLNLSGLAGGQYYATVQDELGCTKDVRVELAESPTVVANFVAPTGGLTDGLGGMTLTFTNTSQGQFTGQTWYFGDTDIPSYDVHAMHTFEEPGSYDVFLNVWNDQCSHTVRKTVVVSQGFVQPIDDEIQFVQTRDFQDNMENFQAPMTTESGWILDLGDASAGMVLHAFDLTGRQLCKPAISDSNGQIWIQSDQWPALVLLRLVHEPTNSVRTWKMVR